MEKINGLWSTLKSKYYHRKAAKKLINQYEYLVEVNKILELWLTKEILNGGSAEFIAKSRQELVTKQNEIKANERFIAFLKKQ